MPATLPLVNRQPITFESAIDQDGNFIHQTTFVAAQEALYRQLQGQREVMAALVQHHLNLSPLHGRTIIVAGRENWVRGGFNVCIPVKVVPPPSSSSVAKQILLIRCPLPYKLAEARYPGTVDEKLRSEVGAYAWMQEHCPDVRIPHLYGFGFSTQRQCAQFTHESHRPFYIRAFQMIRRFYYRFRGYPLLSRYTRHSAGPKNHLPTGYLLLECIQGETGQMLSNVWSKQWEEPKRRRRLYQGLARTMLSLARVPQPRIGSFRINDDGTITLTGRPLTCAMMILENDGTPRTINEKDTFASTDTFVSDMLSFYSSRFLSHPNACYDASDCREQMAIQVILRAISHRYIEPGHRAGPFLVQLTDLHRSNILVDDDWNIACIIDLEWVCALPAEALSVPYWLTGKRTDQLRDEDLAEYDKVRCEFMRVFEEEERRATPARHPTILSRVLSSTWDSGGVWFWHCLTSTNAMFCLVKQHLCSPFAISFDTTDVEEVLSKLWCIDAEAVVEKKVADYGEYKAQLQRLYTEEDESSHKQIASDKTS